jgi:hypothetical protein
MSFAGWQGIQLSQGAKAMTTDARRHAYGEWIASTLDSSALLRATSLGSASPETPPQVLFVRWHASLDVFAVPGSSSDDLNAVLPFHPRWQHVVDRMAGSLAPFVALHWRQEAFAKGVPDFVRCARWAEEQVEALGVKSIYFMTD